MKSIVFTHSGHSHAFGNFSSGTVARVPGDLAKHFVEEAGCARYDGAVIQADEQVQTSVQAHPTGAKFKEPAAKKAVAKKGGKQ